MVLAVVDGEFVFDAVERETSFGDAIAVAADDRAEVGIVLFQIALEIVETEHDVVKLAIAIGDIE